VVKADAGRLATTMLSVAGMLICSSG